jgi:biopolymer transport protein ExbD
VNAMRLRNPARRQQTDGTIAFINIVFLVLIFLLMAGTLAGLEVRRVDPVTLRDAELGMSPDDAIFLAEDGSVRWRGASYDFASLGASIGARTGAAKLDRVRLYTDRQVRAKDAIRLVSVLRANGIHDVALVGVRAVTQ